MDWPAAGGGQALLLARHERGHVGGNPVHDGRGLAEVRAVVHRLLRTRFWGFAGARVQNFVADVARRGGKPSGLFFFS